MITFALNHEIKEVESFFPAWERYFHFFQNLEDIKENTGQELFCAVEEDVFI